MFRKVLYKIKLFKYCIKHGLDPPSMDCLINIYVLQMITGSQRSRVLLDIPQDLIPLVRAHVIAYNIRRRFIIRRYTICYSN